MSYLSQPQFQDPDKARQYLEAIQWPNGPVCPHCGVIGGHYQITGKSARPGLWKCKDCREQFTVTVGTVFERSKIKLNVWLQAVYLLCSSKKGMSAHQLHRVLGVTYKTAWFMAHRIREAFRNDNPSPIGGGGGVVEADETYWGNIKGRKAKRTYANGKAAGGGARHKHKIISLVSREGETRSFQVASVNVKTIRAVLDRNVKKDTKLYTDSASYYRVLPRGTFQSHRMTNHSIGEYAKPGGIHSNTVESYFAILKRGLHGTYHHVSEAHLQRYLQEFDFRFTNRTSQGVDDHQRTNTALKGIAGKRLTYRRTNSRTQAEA